MNVTKLIHSGREYYRSDGTIVGARRTSLLQEGAIVFGIIFTLAVLALVVTQ